MRSSRLVVSGALSALMLLPVGVAAQAPAAEVKTSVAGGFTATINAKAFSKVRKVKVTMGATAVPSGKTVNAYCLQLASTPVPTSGSCSTGWKNLPTDFQVADADGSQTIFAWARATGGVVSAMGQDDTFLDRALPVVSSFNITPTTSTTRTVALTWASTDPGSAAASGIVKYAIVNGDVAPISSSTAWKDTPATSFTVSKGNGVKTVSGFVRDAAGNVSEAVSDTVTLNVAGPTLTLAVADYTKTQTVPITLTAVDGGGVGIAGYIVKENSTTPLASAAGWKVKPTSHVLSAGEGLKTLFAWVKDNNGTISAVASDTVTWDATAPLASFNITPLTTTARTVAVVALGDADGGSPIAFWAIKSGTALPTLSSDWKAFPTNGYPTSFQLPLNDGTKTVSFWTKDAAGNISGTQTDTVEMDLPAPTITSVTLPDYNKTLTTNVQVLASAASGLSVNGYCLQAASTPVPTAGSCSTGWKAAASTFIFGAGEGTRTVFAYVKDTNGGVSAVGSDTTIVDTIKPLATLTVTNDDKACVALSAGGSDTGGSGITHYAARRNNTNAPGFPNAEWKTVSTNATVSLQEGAQTVTIFTRDAAGNVSVVDVTNSKTVTLNSGDTSGCS